MKKQTEANKLISQIQGVSHDYRLLLRFLLELGGATDETIDECSTPTFVDKFKIAFVHKSHDPNVNYQRKEFLGDAFINAIIALYISDHKPASNQMELTNMKHKMVQSRFLGEFFIEKTGIIKLLKPPFEQIKLTRQQERDKIPGDIFESMIGMIFDIIRDTGRYTAVAFEIINNIVIKLLQTVEIPSSGKDPKTVFKETLESHHYLQVPNLPLNTEKTISAVGENKIYKFVVYAKDLRGNKIQISETQGPDEERAASTAYIKANQYINSNAHRERFFSK